MPTQEQVDWALENLNAQDATDRETALGIIRDSDLHPIGLRIVDIRLLTQKEQSKLGLDDLRGDPIAFELEDGSVFFALADDEGNAFGSLQLYDGEGTTTRQFIPQAWFF